MQRLVCALALLLIACGNDLDKVTDIKDLRLIAMKAEPPEIQFGSSEVFSGQPDASVPAEVTFSALVLDPRGGPVTYTWSFCPVESSEACLDFAEQQARADFTELAGDFLADPDYRDNLEAARVQTPTSQAQPLAVTPATLLPLQPYDLADFAVTNTLLADLGAYFALANFYGFGMGSWPSAILDVQADGLAVLGQKRVVVGLRNPSELNPLLGPALGVQFCTAPNDPENCLDFNPPPNRNPVFALPFEVAFGEKASTPFVPYCRNEEEKAAAPECEDRVGRPVLKVGEPLRIRPRFTSESFQEYQVLKGDLQTRQLHVEDATEDLSVAWFITAGGIQDAVTYPKFTRTLDTIYRAPPNPPDTDGVAVVWMVARDQRGGIAWESFEVLVER